MTAFYKQSWFAPVASAATSLLFPSLGDKVAGFLNLSGDAGNAIGNALVGAGIGGLSSGAKGALTGALAGGLTSYAADTLGIGGGYQQMLGALGMGGAGSPLGGGLRDSNMMTTNGVTGGNAGTAAATNAAAGAAKSAGGGALSLFGGGQGATGMLLPLTLASMAGQALSGGPKQAQPIKQTDPNMTRHLEQVDFNRTYRPYAGDPKQYGMGGGQAGFYADNALPSTQYAADGGRITDRRDPRERSFSDDWWDRSYTGAALKALGSGARGAYDAASRVPEMMRGQPVEERAAGGALGAIKGPGSGREDKIPALLSNDEYVIDAETVALLGDGSPEHGAKKLDQFREQVRAHKGKALARGKISPDARPAIAYLKGAR